MNPTPGRRHRLRGRLERDHSDGRGACPYEREVMAGAGPEPSGKCRLGLLPFDPTAPTQASVGLIWTSDHGAPPALEIIDSPVALIIAASHPLAERNRHKTVASLSDGGDAGA